MKDIVFRRFSEAAERNAEELAVTRSTLRKIGLQLIARENEVSRLQLELERVTAERDALRRDRIQSTVWKCGNCGAAITDRVNAYALAGTGTDARYCTKTCAIVAHTKQRAERDEPTGGGT